MAQDRVLIFGKDSCPYTAAAREDYAARGVPFEYLDVKQDHAAMARMLDYSKGARQVPVIVEGSRVIVGFGGS